LPLYSYKRLLQNEAAVERKFMAEKGMQGVSYTKVSSDYFEKRGLERHAGLLALWGLGVAAVVSGDFSGWNFGIAEAGWGGLLIATILVIIMYYGMLFSIGEMAAALPHTGGAYSFARSSMGPWGGFVTGFAETIEYIATTAVIVFFSASYADAITEELFGLSMPVWVWWIILYAIFLLLNISGSAISFKFAIWVSFIALGVVALFALMSIFSGKFSFDNLTNIAPEAGNSTFLPMGIWPIVAAMPFAMWFFLGIEELPLAAEEANNPARDIPKAGIRGMGTLVISALLVLVLNPGISGAKEISESGEPLLDGFRTLLPNSDVAAILAAFALVGLLLLSKDAISNWIT
jgi:ethanolamine permease